MHGQAKIGRLTLADDFLERALKGRGRIKTGGSPQGAHCAGRYVACRRPQPWTTLHCLQVGNVLLIVRGKLLKLAEPLLLDLGTT